MTSVCSLCPSSPLTKLEWIIYHVEFHTLLKFSHGGHNLQKNNAFELAAVLSNVAYWKCADIKTLRNYPFVLLT